MLKVQSSYSYNHISLSPYQPYLSLSYKNNNKRKKQKKVTRKHIRSKQVTQNLTASQSAESSWSGTLVSDATFLLSAAMRIWTSAISARSPDDFPTRIRNVAAFSWVHFNEKHHTTLTCPQSVKRTIPCTYLRNQAKIVKRWGKKLPTATKK